MRINTVSRSGLLFAVTLFYITVAGTLPAATGVTNSKAVTGSTNKAAQAKATAPKFKNETEKRMAFLKAVLVIATSEMVEAMIKSFKITTKGTLAEKKSRHIQIPRAVERCQGCPQGV